MEKKIVVNHRNFLICIFALVITSIPSGFIYLNSGVVRDIPELNITKKDAHRGMFSDYTDRIYDYDRDFDLDDNRINVLVVGISFGRDFANILLESQYRDKINLSYAFNWTESSLKKRVKDCDYIFSFSSKADIPTYVWENIKDSAQVWGIGTKNFGTCNGNIYCHRNSTDYFQRTALLSPGYKELNEEWKAEWGVLYVDLIKPAIINDNTIRVFTPDNKYISQDCRHLTEAGAKWYANELPFDLIFNNK